jgi:tRNA(Ile)-lysidine synthetase-like protein
VNDLLFLETAPAAKKDYHYQWDGRQPIDVVEAGIRIIGERVPQTGNSLDYDDNVRVYLDRAALLFPLVVRNRREGDRYRHAGAPGSRKVKESMRQKKIPIDERDKHPVFLSDDEIVWIKGLPVSEKHKVTSRTEKIFCIRLDEQGEE